MTVTPVALAQNRGNSGLPAGPGNPMAALQQQIDAVAQQVSALAQLGQDVSKLKGQLDGLAQQIAALAHLGEYVSTLQRQLDQLQKQMSVLPAVQQQIDALNNQMGGLGDALAALSAQVAGLGGSGGLGVYDAADKRMGDVVGVQDTLPWVSMKAGGRVFVLQVLPGQLVGQFLWYTDVNCTGSVFLSGSALTNAPSVFSIAAVAEPGGVVYAADAGAVPARIAVRSVLQHDGTCFTFSQSVNQNVLTVTQVLTLDAVFQRPYSVR